MLFPPASFWAPVHVISEFRTRTISASMCSRKFWSPQGSADHSSGGMFASMPNMNGIFPPWSHIQVRL